MKRKKTPGFGRAGSRRVRSNHHTAWKTGRASGWVKNETVFRVPKGALMKDAFEEDKSGAVRRSDKEAFYLGFLRPFPARRRLTIRK